MEIITKNLPLLKFLTLLYLIYKLGFLYGLGLFYLIQYCYIYLVMRSFNYYPLGTNDKTFTFISENEKYQIICLLRFEKLSNEDFKQLIIEKGVKRIERLRYLRRFKFWEYWWELLSVSEALKKVKFVDDDTILNSEGEVVKHCNKILIETVLDLEKELPYKFIFLNNPNSKTGPYII